MFGDIAHGSILFCFGIYLCFWGDGIKSGPLKLVVPHKYLFTCAFCLWFSKYNRVNLKCMLQSR